MYKLQHNSITVCAHSDTSRTNDASIKCHLLFSIKGLLLELVFQNKTVYGQTALFQNQGLLSCAIQVTRLIPG